ncbi:MAG: hypothetical protein JO293_05805 [Candidatus Eremiobacteraeota bacterium]|nr:hypothetical protein [Candidatus Eremiobacteraeota bacterium]MBV8222856.1 hypothetical protein [Candidatus Eremiobacteraeota bacterium]
MGLDVYVGPLTRYFSGDWKTVVQRWADESGTPLHVIRTQPESQDAITDPEMIRPVILRWRRGLSAALEANGNTLADWSEAADTPYFTDKPDWGGWGGLILWSVYAARNSKPPANADPRQYPDDVVYLEAVKDSRSTPFAQIVLGPDYWLPGEFGVIGAPDPMGNNTTFGSVSRLNADLRLLNEQTWNATPQAMAEWHKDLEPGSIESEARFGFSIMLKLAGLAQTNCLPMKLDY